MHKHDQLYIDGRWVSPASARRIEVINPYTEQVIGHVPDADDADADNAVAAARLHASTASSPIARAPRPSLTGSRPIAASSAAISAATRLPRSASRSAKATFAPSFTNRRTVASPIPEAPPLTAATFSSSRPMLDALPFAPRSRHGRTIRQSSVQIHK